MKNLPSSDLEAEETSGSHLEAKSQKSKPFCNGMPLVPLICQLYEVFLKVGVIKYSNYQ